MIKPTVPLPSALVWSAGLRLLFAAILAAPIWAAVFWVLGWGAEP